MGSDRIIYSALKRLLPVFSLFLLAVNTLFSQAYKINVFVSEQPEVPIVVGAVRGDKFNPADTIMPVAGDINFEIPENAPAGVYRLILGQTLAAQVLHEAPQQLDLIFNKEKCIFKTNFNSPFDSLQVITSKENKVWYRFLKVENEYEKKINDLVKQINYFQGTPGDKYYTAKKRDEVIKQYNQIQKEREGLIVSYEKKYPGLFATKMIRMYCEPFLDGNLSQEKRDLIYKKNFFKNLDFSDTALINSPVYTRKAYEYLMSYASNELPREEQVEELERAVDVIISNTKSNPKVADFIVDYLMRGFEMLGLDDLMDHISEIYSPKVPCSSENKSTLERRLDFQKMRSGTEVPGFSLADINGDTISLSDISNRYKLIIFWASWCPHCQQLLPDIYQWYLNRNIDLEVIAISIDSDKKAWEKFIRDRDYNWINCNEPNKWRGKVASAYNVYATPTMFLVDRETKIIAKPLTFNDFLDAIIDLE